MTKLLLLMKERKSYFRNIFQIFVITLEIFLSCRCPVRCKLFSSGEITQDLDIFRSHNKMLSIICLLSGGNGRNGKYPNNCRFCHISGHLTVSWDYEKHFQNVGQVIIDQCLLSLVSARLALFIFLVLTLSFVNSAHTATLPTANDLLKYFHITRWHLQIIKADILTLNSHSLFQF